MERAEDGRDQAENVKMHSAGRIPPAPENEKSYEQVDQTDYAKIIFDVEGLGGGGDNQQRAELAAATLQFVVCLRPNAHGPEALRDLYGAPNGNIAYGQQAIALLDPCGLS